MKARLTWTMTQDGFPDLPDLSRLPMDLQMEASLIIGLRRAILTWRAMERRSTMERQERHPK